MDSKGLMIEPEYHNVLVVPHVHDYMKMFDKPCEIKLMYSEAVT